MSEHWFYCADLRVGLVELDAADARHALQVLRFRPGDELTVFDGRGRVGSARVAAGERGTRGRCVARIEVTAVRECPLPQRPLTIATAACKGDRLDWLVEKCTELGVTNMELVNFERSVVRAGSQHATRLRRTALEACKQCRRAHLPQIDAGRALGDALRRHSSCELFIADPGGQPPDLKGSGTGGRVVVVGPEGGVTEEEMRQLRAASAKPIRLCGNILRVETAAIAAAAVFSL